MEKPANNKLFDDAAEFYTWYMCKLIHPHEQAEVFQTLSQLMRIAQISFSGGNYLSEIEQQSAQQELSLLKEQLLDGTLKKQQTLPRVKSICDKIILNNPKAKLVSYATKIEYKFCLNPTPSSEAENLKQKIDSLLNRIHPSLSSINAQALSQVLARLLEEIPSPSALEADNSKPLLNSVHKELSTLLDKG